MRVLKKGTDHAVPLVSHWRHVPRSQWTESGLSPFSFVGDSRRDRLSYADFPGEEEGVADRLVFCYNELSMATKPAFAQGAQVEHPKFGLGSVLSCTEEYIVIKFDDHGEKKFVLTIVLPNLKKSDRTPPVEKRRSSKKKTVPAA
jgi:hypothetical protein